MSQKQQTLNGPISFQGKGLHTGLNVKMTFLPAEAGSGIRFRRTDMEGAPEVEALADYVVDTSRGTTIERKGVRVSTIEHVMAALWSCGGIFITDKSKPTWRSKPRFYTATVAKTWVRT